MVDGQETRWRYQQSLARGSGFDSGVACIDCPKGITHKRPNLHGVCMGVEREARQHHRFVCGEDGKDLSDGVQSCSTSPL
jgi:hypothetical protein